MELEKLSHALTVCKVRETADIDLGGGLYFVGRTDEEISLVCETCRTPPRTLAREDGWRGFRVRGTLDFSLTGILSKLSAVLAAERIGIFAVSTYNTDYILVKAEHFDRAVRALSEHGYDFV
ncbi:MAG: ACT domain-containing protein [Oscillibacter sp.]|nr:ACT domain-containing protein [Oscillibacter sp.]